MSGRGHFLLLRLGAYGFGGLHFVAMLCMRLYRDDGNKPRCASKHTLRRYVFPLFIIVNVLMFQWIVLYIFQAP
jgi:hypothetical protein